ncbi:hypothetical protein ACFVYF_04435 [Streptomyces sp. NPDC058274]|uniref:hypothetical protein n=1 Tax=Streptomyces sp. NPDC058274 TaxID=3346416 RepID=UPI0036E48F7E
MGVGTFLCSGRSGDRTCLRRAGQRRFTSGGVPLLPGGSSGQVVACAVCQNRCGTDVLDHSMIDGSLRARAGPSGGTLVVEPLEPPEPPAPHLAPSGRESILLRGARIALVEGPYGPVWRGGRAQALITAGAAVQGCAGSAERLPAVVRTPF